MQVYVTTKLVLQTCLVCYFSYSSSFTNKISVALKAIRQCSHGRTDSEHSFASSQWTSWYFPGWFLSGSKNETSRLLTYKILWWKKITSFKSSKRTVPKKLLTFAFKILRFAEYRQLAKSCWGKKAWNEKHCMEWDT